MKHYLKIDKTTDAATFELIYGKTYDELKANPNVVTADEFMLVPSELLDQFPLISLSREDFIANGYDVSKYSDTEMQTLATKIRELLCESYMHDIIVDLAEELEIPKIEMEV